jgi:hypothetical protein
VLLADATPENVVVCEGTPTTRDLGCSAKRSSIEVHEDLEGDFTGKDGKGVDTDEMCEQLGEQGKLGETAHGEEALQNKRAARMRRR